MRIVQIESIKVADNRQRRTFNPEEMADLAASIEKIGLLHPVVVRESGPDAFTLVAGERRIRAIRDLNMLNVPVRCDNQIVPPGYIPAVCMGDLDDLDAWEAELEENTVRMDLTWQERAAAIDSLHRLRDLQAVRRGETHAVSETAMEVRGVNTAEAVDNTRKNIIVARHLEDSEVSRSKTLDDAFKVLKRREEHKRLERIGLEVGRIFTPAMHTLLQGDCREHLLQLPSEHFDVIITDPPYGIDSHEFGDSGGARELGIHYYEDSEKNFFSLMGAALGLFQRVVKPRAHIYIWCDFDKFAWLRAQLERYTWKVFRTPLIMVKTGSGRVPLPQHGPRRQYETVLYAWRGDKQTNAIYSDVFVTTNDQNLGHGAQKPVDAYTNLLMRSIEPGNFVLDPFCGTGTIFPAATQLQCIATGIELSHVAAGIAASRLREEAA